MANIRRGSGGIEGGLGSRSILNTLAKYGRDSAASVIVTDNFSFTVGASDTQITTCYASSWFAGTAATPNNALSAPDNTFTTNTGVTAWYGQWSMTPPPAALGSRLQTVRIHCRTSTTGFSYPDSLDIYYNDTLLGTGTLTGINDISGTRSQIATFTFSGSIISNLDLIQFGVNALAGDGSLQIDAIEWVANHAVVSSAILKYWDGSSWTPKPVKYWDGATWVTKNLKYWTGSTWR